MASPGKTLHFICRSCRQSISRSSSQIRTFTNSSSRSKTIPTFSQTTSPELDALLLDWRQRVFKPAALNSNHRALIYKKSRHSIIDNDPGVTVTMSDGEDIKLEPMVAFDKPNKLDSLAQITRILSDTSDAEAWAQIPAFLEGMQLAGQTVPSWWLEKLTRKANEQGRSRMIKQCAAMVNKTGLSLSNPAVTRELFLGCHEKAAEVGFHGKEFDQEYKHALSLALMLESKEHCGGELNSAQGQVDMRQDLLVVGVMLELTAARAIHTHSAKDIEGTVGSLAQKLVALSGNDILRRDEKQRLEHAVEQWIPIANGIRLAMRVNGLAVAKGRNAESELKAALKKGLNQLDSAIKEGTSKFETEGKRRRANIMLEKLQ